MLQDALEGVQGRPLAAPAKGAQEFRGQSEVEIAASTVL